MLPSSHYCCFLLITVALLFVCSVLSYPTITASSTSTTTALTSSSLQIKEPIVIPARLIRRTPIRLDLEKQRNNNTRGSLKTVELAVSGIAGALAIELSIGTPGQQFLLLFDTGSSDTWVPGPDCSKHNGCLSGRVYRSTQSKTCGTVPKNVQMFNASYGSGAAIGTYFTDSINFKEGQQKQELKNQTLAQVRQSAGSLAEQSTKDGQVMDGIFGAAFPDLTVMASSQNNNVNSPPYTPILQSLYAAHLLPSPIFSVYLDKNNNSSNKNNNEGSIVLGGIHGVIKENQLNYTDIVRESNSKKYMHWSATINSIRLDNGHQYQGNDKNSNSSSSVTKIKVTRKNYLSKPTIFAFDTGTTITLFPMDMAESLILSIWPNAQIDGDFFGAGGASYFKIPDCSKNIPSGNLILELFMTSDRASSSTSTFTLSVPFSNLVEPMSDDDDLDVCQALIGGWETPIIGNMFMANFITTFDFGERKRIGFAPIPS